MKEQQKLSNNNKRLTSLKELRQHFPENQAKEPHQPKSKRVRSARFFDQTDVLKNGHYSQVIFPSPEKIGEDGVDHINMWERPRTQLGDYLNHSHWLKFHHPYFGNFQTMSSFWHFIQSVERDDTLRTMRADILKKFFKEKLTKVHIGNFQAIVMDTHWKRIKQHPNIMNEMKKSTLPFECYYTNDKSGIRARPGIFKWMILGLEEIRKAIKENREPDFTFLRDDLDEYEAGNITLEQLPDIYENLIKRSTDEVAAPVVNTVAAENGMLMAAESNIGDEPMPAVVIPTEAAPEQVLA